MTPRYGLTLVEVLLATILVSLVAATCIPLLREASESLNESKIASDKLVDLGLLADVVMTDPVAFGIEDPDSTTETIVQWPEHPEREPVTVELLRAATSDGDVDHAWLIFRWRRAALARWIAIEDSKQESMTP